MLVNSGSGITAFSRRRLHQELEEAEELYNSTLRELIVEQRRFDVLAKEILGYDVYYHHLAMQVHQAKHQEGSMVLIPRGHGKTLICQITESIGEILVDPNVRIIFASRAVANAKASLDVVKKHFESNEKLRAVFGNFVGESWNKEGIVVSQRNDFARGDTIDIIGQDSAVASKHCNIGFADDLADEKNSRTSGRREALMVFFWKTFYPTVEPDGGKIRITGTRYHPDDFYAHMGAPEGPGLDPTHPDGLMAGSTLVLPAIYEDDDGSEQCLWPEKFTLDGLNKARKGRRVTFESQFQQSVSLMRGSDYVSYDDIDHFDMRDMPEGLPNFMGIDLAIGQLDHHDEFCTLVAAYDPETSDFWYHSMRIGRYKFTKQTEIIVKMSEDHDIVRAVIETTGYQKAQMDEIVKSHPILNIVEYQPKVDKASRFERRTGLFENGKIHIERKLEKLVGQILDFDGSKGNADDAVDAFLLVIRAALGESKKKKPREEPGVF